MDINRLFPDLGGIKHLTLSARNELPNVCAKRFASGLVSLP
jgi:hypothetical protein